MATNATALSDLKIMVLEVYKRDDKDTEMTRAINEAYREMVGCIDPRKMKDQIYKSTVVGREELAIPDTVLRINHPVRLLDPDAPNNSSSSYPLHFYTKDEYDLIEPDPNAATVTNSRPHGYTFWKNSLLFTETPDKVYTIEINIGGEPTILSATSDTTIFAPFWDETIKAGALTRLYAVIERWDQADKWQRIYRWGFAGNETHITGGLELLKQSEDQITQAPLIMRPNYF